MGRLLQPVCFIWDNLELHKGQPVRAYGFLGICTHLSHLAGDLQPPTNPTIQTYINTLRVANNKMTTCL